MRTLLLGGALLVVLQTLGCTDSIEDNCKSLCDWSDQCQGGATPSCTEDCIDGGATPSCTENCIENMKDADDDCRDALDDFAGCVDSNECDDDDCGDEAAGLLADCVEYF